MPKRTAGPRIAVAVALGVAELYGSLSATSLAISQNSRTPSISICSRALSHLLFVCPYVVPESSLSLPLTVYVRKRATIRSMPMAINPFELTCLPLNTADTRPSRRRDIYPTHNPSPCISRLTSRAQTAMNTMSPLQRLGHRSFIPDARGIFARSALLTVCER